MSTSRVFSIFHVTTGVSIALAVYLPLLSNLWAADTEQPPADTKFYKVIDGKVDANTLRGWQVFHSTCYVCHGVDAVGTDIGPNLLDRVRHMTVTQFANLVLNRYRIVVPMDEATAESNVIWRERMFREMERHERGELGELMMPAWEQNFRVRPHLTDLFAYLQARADGALGPGEPQLIPEP